MVPDPARSLRERESEREKLGPISTLGSGHPEHQAAWRNICNLKLAT